MFTNVQKLVKTLRDHEKSVVCLAELNDGRLASSSTDQTIKIWNLFTKNSSNTNLNPSRMANIDNVYAKLKAYQISNKFFLSILSILTVNKDFKIFS